MSLTPLSDTRERPLAPNAPPLDGSVASLVLRTLIAGHPDDIALSGHGPDVPYSALRERVAERRAELGITRRLVMVESSNAVEPIVTYLAALSGGHPVMLVENGDAGSAAARHRHSLIHRFSPDVVALGQADGWALEVHRRGTKHRLHPDLAMLASTSGSTGSPKLVRLSLDNILSNAAAIAEYLQLTSEDRAITTLPMHYCYGLSVMTSHLIAGGGVVLNERSVVEERFWQDFADHGATSFAGVPYTFDLLDASGFARRSLPNLRYITAAGGKLAADRVRRYAGLGRERGFDFVAMYGQTEATARMAYVPPAMAEAAAGAIGVAIPGSSLRIDTDGESDVGELLFSGPGVMLGYAEKPTDFALGRTVHELHTGDLGRLRSDGLFEIVGRSNRFVKVFGLRIDLDRVESLVGTAAVPVRALSVDEQLVLFVLAERHRETVRLRAAEVLGLPRHVIRVLAVSEYPRTSSGKPDTAALALYAIESAESATSRAAPEALSGASDVEAVLRLFRELLGRPDAGLDDSFASLDGDSLSYVEVSIRLEDLLGNIPPDWPTITIRELPTRVTGRAAAAPEASASSTSITFRRRRVGGESGVAVGRRRSRMLGAGRVQRVDVPTVLRALAIVLIVGTHADLFFLQGGAHLLLAVVGFNLARFQFADVPGRSRVSPLIRSITRVVVPAVLWIGAVALVTGMYRPATVFLLNSMVSPAPGWNLQWQFWFLETIVWTMVGLVVTFAIPAVDRFERAHPYVFACGLLTIALAARFAITQQIEAGPMERYTISVLVWLIALGWLIARSHTVTTRIVATVVAVAFSVGIFGDLQRELVVILGLLLLIWVRHLPLPRLIVPLTGMLASASLYIYLTHWQVYRPFEEAAPWLGTLLSLAIGVAVWRGCSTVDARVRAGLRQLHAGRAARLTLVGRARPRR